MTLQYSIVIPTYNRGSRLVEAVNSALAASSQNSEVIVVDDHSDVPAVSVLAHLHDERLRVVLNIDRKGAAGARNFGAKSARGEILFFSDDDDLIQRPYVSTVYDAVKCNAELSYGYGATKIMNSCGSVLIKTVYRENRVIKSTCHVSPYIFGAGEGFWIRKDLFDKLGGFDPDLRIDEDTDLCVRLLLSGGAPYYSCCVASIIDRTEAPKLTNTSGLDLRIKCYLHTFKNNYVSPNITLACRFFLATRVLRIAARQSRFGRYVLHEVLRFEKKGAVRLVYRIYYFAKLIRNALR